jgi:hypothetical protein
MKLKLYNCSCSEFANFGYRRCSLITPILAVVLHETRLAALVFIVTDMGEDSSPAIVASACLSWSIATGRSVVFKADWVAVMK